jgi:magnesium transporter
MMDASGTQSGEDKLHPAEVRDAWPALSWEERAEAFHLMSRGEAEDLFFGLSSTEQAAVILSLPIDERRSWMRLLAPDDVADLIQASPRDQRDSLIALLDEHTRREVMALLHYEEDEAGGLMNPRFARVRPDMNIDEAISYLRRQAREHLETVYYAYVHDEQQHLVGVVSFRQLFRARGDQFVRDVMRTDVVTVPEDMDQEQVGRLFKQHELIAIPVVDKEGHMKGIVTVDDIVEVVEEEATEDIQKMGGTEALDAPYLRIGIRSMIRKRAGWLSALFLGEMLTATAMSYFEGAIERAVVLALFVPLIISSGGNSGSQATTLVIRAMALGEVRTDHWWPIVRRELGSGLALGSILGVIGFVRIVAWNAMSGAYGEHYLAIATTLGVSLVGVVTCGTLAGAVLPLILHRLGFDPASASAPFVATLVDVTGVLLYFGVATVLMSGVLV